MRLLIYSQDGLGLGHLRRAGNVALGTMDRLPGCNVLILADSPTPVLPALSGLDYIKLPTLVKSGRLSSRTASWGPSTLSLDVEDAVSLRSKVILETFREFSPDVVLVDHMPIGVLGELRPMLDWATRGRERPRLFLGLRDILDSAEVIRQAWADSGAYDYVRYYDGVLVFGCRQIFDAELAYELGSYAQKVMYCNYIGPSPEAMAKARPPRSRDEASFLVMGGGGADVFPIAQAFLDAVPVLLSRMNFRALILSGPNMRPDERKALVAQSVPYPVEVLSTSENVFALLQDVSAVVTMAGYNSLCEVLAARKKALVVPRRGPSAEQLIRSRVFAERGLVRMLDPDALTPEGLAEGLIQLLMANEVPDPANIPPLDGAQRTAEAFLDVLNQEA